MPSIDNNTVLWNEADHIVTVLIVASGDFVELNRIGSDIWKMLADGKDETAIVDDLASRYDAPRHQIEKDVKTFLDTMVEKGLLQA